MSNDTTPADAAPYVQLFQRAHQKIVTLERLEEQVMQLLHRRTELQDELRGIQAQINAELESRLKNSDEPPTRVLSAIANSSRNSGGRFAEQSIDPVVTTVE